MQHISTHRKYHRRHPTHDLPSETLWHRLEVPAVLTRLNTTLGGLSEAEVVDRRVRVGFNELTEQGARGPLKILAAQLTSVMVLVLLAAAGLSLVLGDVLEAGAILAIVLLFAVLGFVQEYRAERAIAALRKLVVPTVRVYRDGAQVERSARELVPGDVVLLEAGNLVPADVRLTESANLRVEEASLTGESVPIDKTAGALDRDDLPLGDRRNLAFMGTQISAGRGVGVVVATGMRTELGKIATLLNQVPDEQTPLQRRLDVVGKQLALVGVVVALLVMAIGIAGGEHWDHMLLSAISVAVAVIPEGLPAVVTFTLAIGAQRMLRRNALIRKLPAVETLGSVTVIASDKTGTLTQNQMTVTRLDVMGQQIDLATDDLPPSARLLLVAGALANDATLQPDPAGGERALGDPTEGGLLLAAARVGLQPDALAVALPRAAELPFDAQRKRMTTIHRVPTPLPPELRDLVEPALLGSEAPYLAFTKGAVDLMLTHSASAWDGERAVALSEAVRTRIQQANEELASTGMRVLGVAFRAVPDLNDIHRVEQEQTFIGLVAMIDPPRAEVRAAIATAVDAGIRPVMITGDHPLTAHAIAAQLGMTTHERVLTGAELSAMSDDELDRAVADTAVYARVTPEHKLRIVGALQRTGQVVAMTGDGVNDAPALKQADIGVAMGISGTDVSKEAAAMVLRDDNFATIVAAVQEGRVIYDNLRRFVLFAVAGNIGKVLVMLFWPLPLLLFGLPLPSAVALLPLQLLWLNLLTDGLLGLSMGFERAESNVMRRPPVVPNTSIFSDGLGRRAVWIGTLIGLLALGAGQWYAAAGQPQWQTMIFTSLALMQVFQALAIRSNSAPALGPGLFSNRVLWLTVVLVVALQIAALLLPVLAGPLLQLSPLGPADLLICVLLGVVVFAAIELEKAVARRRLRAAPGLPASSARA